MIFPFGTFQGQIKVISQPDLTNDVQSFQILESKSGCIEVIINILVFILMNKPTNYKIQLFVENKKENNKTTFKEKEKQTLLMRALLVFLMII